MSKPAPQTQPVASAAEGEALMNHLMEVMDALLAMVAKETALVRTGRLAEAAQLEADKAELSGMYLTAAARIKASQI